MITSTLAANIFSKLGSNSSLLPMIVKDSAHSGGMTAASYATGKGVEGKDRFIDEIGAEIIWVGGIPFYKKVIDLGIKATGYNPKVDIRVLKDKKIRDLALKYAPDNKPGELGKIGQSIQKAINNEGTFKGLFIAKFIAATALTLGSYWGLTIFRHKHTEKSIIKQIKKEEAEKRAKKQELKQNNQKPSFGMNLSGLKDFMFNPVKNMMIVDGGITAERLGESRNPQDFLGYVVKEGAFWGFMYFAGERIQRHFEKRAEKKHNISIDLDIKVLQDKELKEAFKNDEVMKSIKEIKKFEKPDELYKFICIKDDNLVVKMAKKSGLVSVCKNEKGKEVVDTQHFIDLEEVKGVGEKIEKLFNQYQSFNNKAPGKKIEEFIHQTVKLKRMSIIKNIGSCMGVLGVVVPGIMLALRFAHKDNKEFAVKKAIHEKLKKQNNFT